MQRRRARALSTTRFGVQRQEPASAALRAQAAHTGTHLRPRTAWRTGVPCALPAQRQPRQQRCGSPTCCSPAAGAAVTSAQVVRVRERCGVLAAVRWRGCAGERARTRRSSAGSCAGCAPPISPTAAAALDRVPGVAPAAGRGEACERVRQHVAPPSRARTLEQTQQPVQTRAAAVSRFGHGGVRTMTTRRGRGRGRCAVVVVQRRRTHAGQCKYVLRLV